ncbi:hypothetical protein FQA39_LY17065 [Lamprigera yunnana]|nr:hypothetical protein FQA39_LY17065 [Lamprigera yunnana]
MDNDGVFELLAVFTPSADDTKGVFKLELGINESVKNSKGRRNIRVLKLLPNLVSPVAITTKWKPSKSVIDDGFIMRVKVNYNFSYFLKLSMRLQDLYGAVEQSKLILKTLKLIFQFIPIIVGWNLDHIQHTYVRVNNVLYNVETPLKAIDTTFKAIHSFIASEAEQVF